MSIKAYVAEVKVTYTNEAFNGSAQQMLRDWLEENGCYIYCMENNSCGCSQEWELNKDEVQEVIDGLNDGSIELSDKFVETVGNDGVLRAFLTSLVISNKGDTVCHIHWF